MVTDICGRAVRYVLEENRLNKNQLNHELKHSYQTSSGTRLKNMLNSVRKYASSMMKEFPGLSIFSHESGRFCHCLQKMIVGTESRLHEFENRYNGTRFERLQAVL